MGNVYNIFKKTKMKGNNCMGYVGLTLQREGEKQKAVLGHNIVFECFEGPKPLTDEYMDIHHANGITTDNRLSNLQLMSRSDHNRETIATNPMGRVSTGKSLSRPVIKFLKNGGEEVFPSIGHANRSMEESDQRQFNRVLKTGDRVSYMGFDWAFAPQPDLENELWATPPKEYNGIEVSNRGRIRSKTGSFHGFERPS
jgi:hypothetical protein